MTAIADDLPDWQDLRSINEVMLANLPGGGDGDGGGVEDDGEGTIEYI